MLGLCPLVQDLGGTGFGWLFNESDFTWSRVALITASSSRTSERIPSMPSSFSSADSSSPWLWKAVTKASILKDLSGGWMYIVHYDLWRMHVVIPDSISHPIPSYPIPYLRTYSRSTSRMLTMYGPKTESSVPNSVSFFPSHREKWFDITSETFHVMVLFC